ncbi:MAG: DNA ligase D [Bauldia sp.]|nr:DNA ligase D [Bauldia sp.]
MYRPADLPDDIDGDALLARASTISDNVKEKLRAYREKRDFARTPEPTPTAKAGEAFRFCVQKHAARRLHYDLRLELDGVLKSWAVTRGPSLVTTEKRLAVQTEDHPLEYLEFEGVIPEGEYGAGTMIVWDQGRWEPVEDPHKGLAKGHLSFNLHGQRLHGHWHLVRMQKRPGEKKEQWLLIKGNDEFARPPGEAELIEEETASILSGRTNDDLKAEGAVRKDHAARQTTVRAREVKLPALPEMNGARKGILPVFVEPTLATLTDKVPGGNRWIHEIKLDGYRIAARIDAGKVKLMTRKGLDWTPKFSVIAEKLKGFGFGSAMLDGEVVVENENGISVFGLLQDALATGQQERVVYYVFDILYYEGIDLQGAKLIDRKEFLKKVFDAVGPDARIRYAEHLEENGQEMLDHACRLGLEGTISKRKDLPYKPGRADTWLKNKCTHEQEFVVVGYVPSTAVPGAIGSLALAVYDDDGHLIYVGRVGTGFNQKTARALADELRKIEVKKRHAFAKALPADAERGAKWVEPRMVVEVEYRSRTQENILRHSSFKGVREDKDPTEIRMEWAANVPIEEAPVVEAKGTPRIEGVELTHPDRVLWEADGLTKLGLAQFYVSIADWIVPHLVGRPLSMFRCPQGIGKPCFFAKHPWGEIDKSVKHVDTGDEKPMMWIEDLRGLVALVQSGVLEIHPWGSKVGDLDRPDRLFFDLDPGEGTTWNDIIVAAKEVRERLKKVKLESFVKTSGGKGLHVVVPLTPSADWEAAKAFCKKIADDMTADSPDRYLATISKKARVGKIFIDYLRNGRGATAVAAYSTRARAGAPVSTPVEWSELTDTLRPNHFTVANLGRRLERQKHDPWADFFKVKQKLPKAS